MVGRSLSGGSPTPSRSSKSSGTKTSTRRGVGSSLQGQVVEAPSGGGGDGKGLFGEGASLVGKTLQALDYGRRGIFAGIKELTDVVPVLPGREALGGKVAKDGFSLGDLRKNFNANIGGGDYAQFDNKWVNRAIGLGLDLAIDPLSYLTVGAGTATKATAKVGGKGLQLGGRATATELARTIAKAGDKELANRVLTRGVRGSANVLTKKEAEQYGIRQGITFGAGKAKVAVPGGDAVARTVSKALSPATDQLSKLPLHGIGNALKGATPLERQLARDADRARRVAAKGTRQQATREISKVLSENPDYDSALIRDAIEGVGAPHPAAERITKVLDDTHAWAETQLGRELPTRDNYLSHRMTAEARDMQAGKAGGRRGRTPGVLKHRETGPGDIFYGKVLVDGSITERNRIFQEATGRKHNYWEDDPIKIAHQYVDDMTRMVARSEESFATAAGAISAPLKAVPEKGAKAAAKEAKGIDKQLQAAVAELDKTRAGIKGAQAGASVADDAALAAVRSANAAGKLVPEASTAGLLADLPDLKTKLAALAAATGRDNRIASDELLELTGAKATGGVEQGERAFLMPDGKVVPERNIEAHAAANAQLQDLKERLAAARADVSAKLRPEAQAQAKTIDHAAVVNDPELLLSEAADNLKSLDAQRVLRFKADQEKLSLRAEADRLYTEAARLRAAGDDELAQVAALEAHARKIEADMPDLDKKFQKALVKANDVKFVRDIEAMTRQGLVELADGRYAEPWVAEAAQQIAKATTPAEVGKLIKTFDKVSGFWRATALLSPGFHSRNFIGAMFNNSMADMDWGRYAQYHKARMEFSKGGIEAISDRQVRAAAAAAAKDGQWLADSSRVTDEVSQLAGQTGGILNNRVFRRNLKIGAGVEQYARMPLYIDTYIKSGGDSVAALDAVMKYHFDYDDLSRMEREVGRRAFGFYTWSRNNLPLMMSEMADRPGVFARYTHLKRNMELGTDPEDNKPSYFNKALAIALPFKFAGGRVFAFPELPFIAAGNQLGVSQLASNLNPLVKLPLETFTNTKFFEQRQMSDTLRSTPAAWRPILEVLVHTGGIPGLPKVHKAADGSLMMDEREANKIESLFPLLARMRRLAPSEDKYQDRVLTSWLSFVGGISTRTLDEATKGGEAQRREAAANKATKQNATLEGGSTLEEFKAAERQSKAIQAAQASRGGR